MKAEFNPVFDINRASVYRRMRLRTGTPVFEAVQRIYDACLKKTDASMAYQVLYLLEKNQHCITQPTLDQCEKLLYCFVTVGDPVMDVIEEHFGDGRYLEGYLINEMANEVVMSSATQLYKHVKKRVNNQGCRLTRRFSPGECHLDLNVNRVVMDVLEASFNVSATLTDQMMLNPPKSMLFLYGVDPHLPDEQKDTDCTACLRVKCDYREA